MSKTRTENRVEQKNKYKLINIRWEWRLKGVQGEETDKGERDKNCRRRSELNRQIQYI